MSGYTCVPSLILLNSKKENGDNGIEPGHFSISGFLLMEEWFLPLFAVLSRMLFSCFYNLTTLLLIENDFFGAVCRIKAGIVTELLSAGERKSKCSLEEPSGHFLL